MKWRRLLAATGVRMRTTAVAVVALALAMAAAGVVVVVLLEESLDRSVTESARSTGRQVAIQLAREGARDLSASDVASTGDTEAVTQVLDMRGRPIASDPAIVGRPALTGARPVQGNEIVETLPLGLNGDGAEYRVVSQLVNGPGGPYTVVSARSLEPVTEASTRLTLLLGVIALPLLAISGLAVYRAVGSALRPVERMRRAVAEISTRDLTARVGLPPGRDEVHRLATTLNSMLGRLASAQSAQRRFVADASHELRSPLSTISTALDVSSQHPESFGTDELVPVIARETARLRELVDDLLVLARTDDTTDRPSNTEVDLDDIVRAEAERVSPGAELEIEVRAGPAKVHGSEAQLGRAVRNLVDNARDHARKRLRVVSRVTGGYAVVEVSDDGPGVAAVDRERVFERFVRLDASRQRHHGGTGLGLPIVAGIATRHGGRARYVESDDSRYPGACFVIELPVIEED
ncbi:sensor histidine kinase [Amycolatopsis sp. H20-H5]|uniref:sensor histidine kinase n=1 Tax=Amycolatopsis sp. H20-H5 TaxID=3046309 RepID=UPI002DBB2FF2|nr:HAMP domain-containing sensor histidine kinase [Amycolatopsis sp. H20-H5]MEC3979953.1 HAMP domain-containing sensor histidine kinase [Amycolatopsis sp. H20-H5]